MSSRKFFMPKNAPIGEVRPSGEVELNQAMFKYLGGLEDVSGRVAANLDPGTATAADIVNALITAGLMKDS